MVTRNARATAMVAAGVTTMGLVCAGRDIRAKIVQPATAPMAVRDVGTVTNGAVTVSVREDSWELTALTWHAQRLAHAPIVLVRIPCVQHASWIHLKGVYTANQLRQ